MVVGLGLGPACRSSGSGTTGGGWGQSPHETASNESDASVGAATLGEDSIEAPGLSIVDLAFDVTRVEFPIGGVRSSLKLWNHVDMMRVDAEWAASLARNGIRLGVGAPQAWPALRAVIENGQGQVFRDEVAVPRGQPLLLDLGPVSESAAVFAFDRAGRLSGRTFEAGRFVVQLDYEYQSGPVRSLEVQVGMEIRTDHGVMTWERQGAIIRQVPSIDRHVFDGVRAALTLSDGEFMVLGPDADQAGAYLIGNQCLVRERNGEMREIVLFLTPKILQRDGVASGTRSR